MLGRPGLYIRELDVSVLFLVFKGNDLHSGFSPTVNAAEEHKWRTEMLHSVHSIYNMVGPENRLGYVSYPANVACHRLGAMSITPSLTFGNAGADPARKDVYMDYARHGLHLVGARAHYNRLAREIVYHNHNYAQHTGLQGLLDPADALRAMTYVNDDGFTLHCDPIPFHAIHDATLLAHWRGRYKYHYLNCHAYRVNVVKHRYKAAQSKLKQAGQPSHPLPPIQSLRTGIPRWSRETIATSIEPSKKYFSEIDIFGRPDSPLSDCSEMEIEQNQEPPVELSLSTSEDNQVREASESSANSVLLDIPCSSRTGTTEPATSNVS